MSSAQIEYQTVKARPITFAEIEALAARDAEPVDIYWVEHTRQHGATLTPARLTPIPKQGHAYFDAPVPHGEVHAAVENTSPNATTRWKADKDTVVGYEVRFDITTMFGVQTGGQLFSSPEAERTASLVLGYQDPADRRERIYVQDSKAGRDERLTPVHGSQVTISMVLTGVDAEDGLARATAALQAEFGDAVRPNMKAQSRPVAEKRVNVYANPDGQVIAVNVLTAEVSNYMRTSSVTTEEVDPAAPPIEVGR